MVVVLEETQKRVKIPLRKLKSEDSKKAEWLTDIPFHLEPTLKLKPPQNNSSVSFTDALAPYSRPEVLSEAL